MILSLLDCETRSGLLMYVWLVFHPFWLVFISLSQPSHFRSSPSLLHTRVLTTSGPVAYCSHWWAVRLGVGCWHFWDSYRLDVSSDVAILDVSSDVAILDVSSDVAMFLAFLLELVVVAAMPKINQQKPSVAANQLVDCGYQGADRLGRFLGLGYAVIFCHCLLYIIFCHCLFGKTFIDCCRLTQNHVGLWLVILCLGLPSKWLGSWLLGTGWNVCERSMLIWFECVLPTACSIYRPSTFWIWWIRALPRRSGYLACCPNVCHQFCFFNPIIKWMHHHLELVDKFEDTKPISSLNLRNFATDQGEGWFKNKSGWTLRTVRKELETPLGISWNVTVCQCSVSWRSHQKGPWT